MSSMKESVLNITNIHIRRLQDALHGLQDYMPLHIETIQDMSTEIFSLTEIMTSRFSKLQDHVGQKLVNLFMESNKEPVAGLSMLDKLHKLEKLHVIDNINEWDKFRILRNHIAHEYPEQPELTAKYLNETYSLAPQLISLAQKIMQGIN